MTKYSSFVFHRPSRSLYGLVAEARKRLVVVEVTVDI